MGLEKFCSSGLFLIEAYSDRPARKEGPRGPGPVGGGVVITSKEWNLRRRRETVDKLQSHDQSPRCFNGTTLEIFSSGVSFRIDTATSEP